METKRPLAPGFLNRLDRRLLLNKPETWSSRVHLVLYYSILFIAVLAVIAFIIPDDPRTGSKYPRWVGFVSLISFIAFVTWIIYLLRFNVFKRFGAKRPIDRLITFAIYFLCTGCFVFFPFVKPIVENIRANMSYGRKEIGHDVDQLNMDLTRFYFDAMDHHWPLTHIQVVDSVRFEIGPPIAGRFDTINGNAYPAQLQYVTPKDLADRILEADSVVKQNDSSYLFYTCPNYIFTERVGYYPDRIYGSMASTDIYKAVIKNYKKEEPAAIESRIRAVVDKYYVPYTEDYDYYPQQTTVYTEAAKRFHLKGIGRSMSNIIDRKNIFNERQLPAFIRIYIYISLVLSLLLFSFRHSTVRAFFMSILTGVILTVATALFIAFSRSVSLFGGLTVFYFIIFTVISISALNAKIRDTATGIAVNLFLWLLPFVPMCIVLGYYEGRNRYYEDYAAETRAMQKAEWLGLVLLILALTFFLPRIYRRWFAAAEQ